MIQIYVILNKKYIYHLFSMCILVNILFACFQPHPQRILFSRPDVTWLTNLQENKGAGDEIGMFPKEESHVRVMTFASK